MHSGSDVVVQCLRQEGVEVAFGQIGHTLTNLLDTVTQAGISFVSARHEQVAAHAADAYARLTGRPSVLLLHVGPGLSNALVGVANACVDNVPMIVVAGDVPSYHWGKEPFQELRLHADASQHELFRPAVKRAWRVHSVDALGDIMARAYNLATSGRPGPVLVDLPMDIANARGSAAVPAIKARRPSSDRVAGDPAEVRRAARLLVEARNPAIYADNLASRQGAGPAILALAEYLGIPVGTSGVAKGIVDEHHPLAMGATGLRGNPVAHRVLREADVLLAVGTTFPEVDSSSWDQERVFRIPPTRLIQIDSEPYEIGKIYPVEVGVVGHSAAVLDQLLEAIRELTAPVDWEQLPRVAATRGEMETWLASLRTGQISTADPMESARLVHEVEQLLPADGVLVTDVGFNKYLVHQQVRLSAGQRLVMAGPFAPMGFGPAAALGAKLACPGSAVVALVGDGAMSAVETTLVTAAEYNVCAVWVVLNNYSYGVVRPIQIGKYGGRMVGTEFRTVDGRPYNPDFAALARDHGMEGIRVEHPDDFKPALRQALASDRPALLDVIVRTDVAAPMTGTWDMMGLQTPSEIASGLRGL